MRIAFTTLGCKVNQFDTAIMSQGVSQNNYEVVTYEDPADLYIINTCTVTENADLESRAWVKKALHLNPAAKIIVTGCYAQTNPSEIMKIPGVNLVLGNEEKKEISNLLDILDTIDEPVSCVGEIARQKVFRQPLLESFLEKTRAFLKIQDGCNAWCSFCIIPRARGRSRSYPKEEILSQIHLFERNGYREVVFSGINLGSYGLDLRPKTSLLSLFKEIQNKTKSIRFRMSSIEPDLFSEDLVDTFAASQRICRHFHIPLQSGDSEILKSMGRRYTPDEYRETIENLHQKIPESSIGADIMVGFPGETEKSFQNTCDLISKLPLSYLHVFPYSARERTEAYSYADTVSLQEKKERARHIRRLGKLKTEQFKSQFIGKSLQVLIEEFKPEDPHHKIKGLTDNYLKVLIENGKGLKPNDFVEVIAHSIDEDYLIGRVDPLI